MANVVYFNDGVKLPCCPTLLESLYLSASGTCAGDCNANYTGFVAGDLSYNIVYTLPTASGTSGQVLTTDGNNNLSWTTVSGGGGGGTPAGIDGYIQYNNGGSFGGASILYWNDLNSRLGIGTATPNQTLEVAGTMRLTGSTGTPVSILGRDANGDISNVALGSNFLLSGGTLSLSGVTVSGYVPYTGATQNLNLGLFSSTSSGVTTPYLQISTAGSSTPMQEGMLRWNNTDRTYEFMMGGGNVLQQIGQELPVPVKHADNAGLQNGKVVYYVSSDGTNKLVRYAIASGESESAGVFGLMTEDASGGSKALCTTFGYVRDIDTSTLEEGKIVWLSDTELGGMTTTRPTQPSHGVQVGFCIRQHATEGAIFVSIQNGYELDELHNVLISSGITNQEMLFYNSALKVWQNKTAAAANLVSGSGTATQVAFWKSGSTNELQGSSNLYWDNVNSRLGVGTSTPSSTLDIAGALRVGVSNIFTISNNVISTPGATNAFIGIGGDRFLNITNGATTQTIINFDGTSRNVGIGIGPNLAGSARLHVAGSGITAAGWTAQFHNSGGTSNSLMIRNDGNVAIGNNSPNARLQVHGTDTSDTGWTAQFHNSLGNSNSLMIRNDGNVGVGTNNPTVKLQINGITGDNFRVTNGVRNAYIQTTNNSVSFTTGTNGSGGGLSMAGDGSSLQFQASNQQKMLIVGNTGNVIIQNSGTFTDDGVNRLQVTGSAKFTGKVEIGTTVSNASAALEVASTTQGFLSPRMTTAQRDAIVSPAQGLEIFNTTITSKQVYNGTEWEILNGARQIVVASSITTPVVFRNGNVVDLVLQSSTTLTLSNAAVGNYIIKITQSGSGSNTVSWPVNVLWSGGFTPTLTPTVGKQDVITLLYDGTNYYGTYALNF